MSEGVRKYDKDMDHKSITRDGMDWYSADTPGFCLDGLHWRKAGEPFRRIPLDAHVTEAVDHLAWHTAGCMLRFKSDAAEIRVHVRYEKVDRWDHMPCTAYMGVDLYTGSGTAKFYHKTARFNCQENEYTSIIFGPGMEKKMREFTIHFPLYAHPEEFEIGLTCGSVIAEPEPWIDPRPIVVYGTSIQQGGCASRPGMCHTNIMSRLLNRPFVNLGFSGSANGEPEMAHVMAKVKDPAMFVLDFDANAGVGRLRQNLPGFIDILREKHPETPILLISRLLYAAEIAGDLEFVPIRRDFTSIHINELERRRKMGDQNIHFLDGSTLYGPDPSECTVDGVHATDLGFYHISRRTAPVIARILSTIK